VNCCAWLCPVCVKVLYPTFSVLVRWQWPKALNKRLEEVDPELFDIIEHEKNRQWKVHFLRFAAYVGQLHVRPYIRCSCIVL